MKIGNLDLGKQPVFLAPMEGVTNKVFRLLCKEQGADFCFTEFVSSDALIRQVKQSLSKIEIIPAERPMGIQIYGREVEPMVEAAKLVEGFNPETIDINFGCPVKKIAIKGAGSGMLRDVPKLIKITEKIVKAVRKPVTVKTRIGWDENSINIVEVSERLQDVGVQALTLHGRTRSQMYKGAANWEIIGKVKNNSRLHIPVIGNGDIDSAVKAKEVFDKYGVDGIMVGRACIGRYWIFKEIKHYLRTGKILPTYSTSEKVRLIKIHFEKTLTHKDTERRAIIEMRRHFAKCFTSLPNFRETKTKLLESNNKEEILKILEYIAEKYS